MKSKYIKFLLDFEKFVYLCRPKYMVGVVQLVRASDCGSECRGFESHLPPLQGRRFSCGFFCYYRLPASAGKCSRAGGYGDASLSHCQSTCTCPTA